MKAIPMTPALATLLAQASEYAYTSDDAGMPRELKRAIHFSDGSGFRNACLLRFPDKAILAFQGTITEGSFASVEDWLADFRIKLVPARLGINGQGVSAVELPGLVHNGFYSQLSGNYAAIVDLLKGGLDVPLYVTGHSQGGAVATLAAAALTLAGFPVEEVATFAAPRAGDGAFALAMTVPVWRFEYADDIVPHVPTVSHLSTFMMLAEGLVIPALSYLFSDHYSSVGTLVYSDGPRTPARTITATAEGTLRRERMLRMAKAGLGLLHDHYCSNYLTMTRRWSP